MTKEDDLHPATSWSRLGTYSVRSSKMIFRQWTPKTIEPLGVGLFHSQVAPQGGSVCQGVCILDAADGSLRMTEQLAENFSEMIREAIRQIEVVNEPDLELMGALNRLLVFSDSLSSVDLDAQIDSRNAIKSDWVRGAGLTTCTAFRK